MKIIREILYITFSAIYFFVIAVPIGILLFILIVIIDAIKRAGKSLAQRQTVKK